jgi:putative lipoprotein
VTSYNNGKEAVVGVVEASTLTIEFGTDGTMSGNGGVNTYSGPFTVDGTSVTIGPLASTMMAGPDKLMTQETQLLAALQNAKEWSVVNGRLELRDTEGALQVIAEARQ